MPSLRCVIAGLGLVAALWNAGCAKSQPAPTVAIFCLFDISGSTSARPVREAYFQDFKKILGGLWGGEAIKGDVITENSLARSSIPLDVSFPVKRWSDNPITFQEKLQQATAEAEKVARKLILETAPAAATDLMNAFQLADKMFNGEQWRAARTKVLVVFSDMVEQSQRYNFSALKLDASEVQHIIEAERTAGRLPNLNGVKTWVAGATANPSQGLHPDKIYAIQNFWLEYFKAAGADLTRERYGPKLINFSLPRPSTQ